MKNLMFLVLAVTLFLTACKKDAAAPGEMLSLIPETAASVTTINLKSLMEKADFEEVKKMEFYQNAIKEAGKENAAFAAVLNDPAASGIDLDGQLIMAMDFDKNDPEKVLNLIMLPLKDEGDFEKLVLAADGKIEDKEGIKFVNADQEGALAWKDGVAIFAMANGGSGAQARIIEIFKNKGKNSIASNDNLQKALDGKHDMNGWFSTNSFAENPNAGFMLKMIDIEPEALKDNYIHSYGDFEKGKITGHSTFFISKDLGEKFIGRFFKDEVKTDFSAIVPGQNLTFATVAALDIVGIDKWLSERPSVKNYADMGLRDMDITMQDLTNSLGGDLLVAGFTRGAGEEPAILMAFNIKDKAAAKTLVQKAVTKGILKETGTDMYEMANDYGAPQGKLLVRKDMIVVSMDNALVDKLAAGDLPSGERAGKEVFQNFDDQTVAGWFTFETIKDMMGGAEMDIFKDLKFSINSKGADFLMNTKNADENSLKSILKMANEAYKKDKGQMAEPM